MKKEITNWIAAAKIFSENKNATVECPECHKGILMVIDEVIDEKNKIDRYLKCNNCGKWNVITMTKSDE